MMNYMEYCIIFMTSTYCLNYNYDSHVQAINNEMFFNNKILFSMLFVISAVALLPFSVIFNFSFDMLVFVSSEFEKFSDIIMEFMLFKLSAKLSEKSNNDSSSSLTLSLFLRYVEKNRWSKAIQILQTTKMALFIRDSPADEYDIQAHELWIRSCERFKYVNPAVGETVLHRAILSSCKVIATVDPAPDPPPFPVAATKTTSSTGTGLFTPPIKMFTNFIFVILKFAVYAFVSDIKDR